MKSISWSHALLLCVFVLAAFSACSKDDDDDGAATPPATASADDGGGGTPVTTCPNPNAYPAAPYGTAQDQVLEGLSFDGVHADGTAGAVTLTDAFAACPNDVNAKVIILRVGASFCGTCREDAMSTNELLPASVQDHARIIDLLVRNEDNDPADVAAATRWQQLQDAKTDVAVDPAMRFIVSQTALPRVLIVDPRTMTVRASLANPEAEEIENAAASVIAEITNQPAPAPRAIVKSDNRFTRRQLKMLSRFPLTGNPPPDPTNTYGDNTAVAALGLKLFSDKNLSPSLEVSCERCHEADRSFTDAADTATGGVGGGVRNTPTMVLAAWSPWQFWDGRADSLWMQALGPFENPNEFGSSRLFVVHRVFDAYRDDYEALFGPMLRFDDTGHYPVNGKPGDVTWATLSAEDQHAVTDVFVKVGKSIAAYERTFRVLPNPVDKYALGDLTALTDDQKDGLLAFFETGCVQCHYGPRLTDDSFHVMRFPSGHDDFTPDNGRIEAVAQFDANEFRGDEQWSDAKRPKRALVSDPRLLGSFKTPALRGVALTAPYGHGGSVPLIEMAVDLHRTLGEPEGNRFATGTIEPWVIPFDPSKNAALVTLMRSLSFSR